MYSTWIRNSSERWLVFGIRLLFTEKDGCWWKTVILYKDEGGRCRISIRWSDVNWWSRSWLIIRIAVSFIQHLGFPRVMHDLLGNLSWTPSLDFYFFSLYFARLTLRLFCWRQLQASIICSLQSLSCEKPHIYSEDEGPRGFGCDMDIPQPRPQTLISSSSSWSISIK